MFIYLCKDRVVFLSIFFCKIYFPVHISKKTFEVYLFYFSLQLDIHLIKLTVQSCAAIVCVVQPILTQ